MTTAQASGGVGGGSTLIVGGLMIGTTIPASTSYFFPLAGGSSINTTDETIFRTPMQKAGTIVGWRAVNGAAVSANNVTLTVRKNGADIAASTLTYATTDAAGTVKAATFTTAFAAGDLLGVEETNTNGSTANPQYFQWVLEVVF